MKRVHIWTLSRVRLVTTGKPHIYKWATQYKTYSNVIGGNSRQLLYPRKYVKLVSVTRSLKEAYKGVVYRIRNAGSCKAIPLNVKTTIVIVLYSPSFPL